MYLGNQNAMNRRMNLQNTTRRNAVTRNSLVSGFIKNWVITIIKKICQNKYMRKSSYEDHIKKKPED